MPRVILMVGLLATPVVAQGISYLHSSRAQGLWGLRRAKLLGSAYCIPGIPEPVALVQVPITLIIEDDQGKHPREPGFRPNGWDWAKSRISLCECGCDYARTNSRLHAYLGQLNRRVSSGHSGSGYCGQRDREDISTGAVTGST